MYRRISLPFVICLVLWLAACGSGNGRHSAASSTTAASGNGFLYISDSAANDIFGFRIDNSSGSLTPIAGSPFRATGSAPGRLTVDHAQRFLFGVNAVSATLASYVIDHQAGILAASSSIAVEADPHSVATHPSANFVYVLSGNAVSGFSYDDNGIMTPLPNSLQKLSAPSTQGIAITLAAVFCSLRYSPDCPPTKSVLMVH